jgi:2'-5' RNA ligase
LPLLPYIGGMMENLPLTLWLIPEPTTLAPLHSLILKLSEKFGGPSFSPHITLLSQIAVSQDIALERSARLADVTRPFIVSSGRVLWSFEYFQGLVIEIGLTHDLLRARRLAEHLFPSHTSTPFVPHLSLAYGLIDETQASEARQKIAGQIPRGFVCGGLQVVYASRGMNVESWRPVRTFPLGNDSPRSIIPEGL